MESKDSFVPRLMRAAWDSTCVQVCGDGSQLRGLVHVDDAVVGLPLAWRNRFAGPLILASGESVTVSDIIEAASSVTEAAIPAETVPPKPGGMPAVLLDISTARGLGYTPAYDLESGITTVWPELAPSAAEGNAAQ
jgi:UDP-glucose 4-epimerase